MKTCSPEKDIERRSVDGLEVRIVEGSPRLEGRAVVYGALSEELFGFREIIGAGAFREHLATEPDIRALREHDSRLLLGRTPNTLTVSEDDTGVNVSIFPPDDEAGRSTVAAVKRGDLRGMSFGMKVLDDEWTMIDGEQVRTVTRAELFDVSLTAFPAYSETTLAVRSRAAATHKERSTMATDTIEERETAVLDKAPEAPAKEPVTEKTEPQPTPERRSAPIAPSATSAGNGTGWRDHRTGTEVRVLRRADKYTDLHPPNGLSLGRAIRAMVIGDWTHAEGEQRALSTSANPSAGILIPNPLASRVIDLARAQSVLMQAGAKIVDMTSTTLTIARVSGDATIEVHNENSSFTGSDLTFDAVELTSFTLGAVVKMSRELAADAPNAVSLIEDLIARKLAERIDFYGLQGTGSAQPLGLVNFSGTNTVAVGGAVDYDNILDAVKENDIDNHVSNAVIVSPTNVNILRQLKVNAEANHYASPPAAVQSLSTLVTTNIPDATMAVGDFSKFLIGLRQGPVVEVTSEGGTSFADHSVWIKIVWRGAFNIEDAKAMCLLTGIS